MEIPKKFSIPIIIFIIAMSVLYILPVSNDKVDVFFSVKVTNDIWNNPKISYVDVYTKPATFLPSNYAMASFISTGDLDLLTTVGTHSTTKKVGKLYVSTDTSVTYKVPGVPKEEANFYTIILRENRIEVDRTEGII